MKRIVFDPKIEWEWLDVKVEPLLITLLLLHQDNTPKDQSKVKMKMKKEKWKLNHYWSHSSTYIKITHHQKDQSKVKVKKKVKVKVEPLVIRSLSSSLHQDSTPSKRSISSSQNLGGPGDYFADKWVLFDLIFSLIMEKKRAQFFVKKIEISFPDW